MVTCTILQRLADRNVQKPRNDNITSIPANVKAGGSLRPLFDVIHYT